MWLHVQSDYKKKVFNLEECMNNECLTPRENSCKWFNELWVMRRRLYIVRWSKTKFLHENNIVNRFTKWVNRFIQQKTTQKCMKDETIQCTCELIHVNPGWRLIRFNLLLIQFGVSQRVLVSRFKCESIQEVVNGFIWSQRLGWIDSVYYESIQ